MGGAPAEHYYRQADQMTTVNVQDDIVYGYWQEMERRGRDKKEVPALINSVLKEHLSGLRAEKLAAPELKKPKQPRTKAEGPTKNLPQSAFLVPARGTL